MPLQELHDRITHALQAIAADMLPPSLGWIWLPCECVPCDPRCTHWRTVINTWETWTVPAADSLCLSRVSWEKNFFNNFWNHTILLYISYLKLEASGSCEIGTVHQTTDHLIPEDSSLEGRVFSSCGHTLTGVQIFHWQLQMILDADGTYIDVLIWLSLSCKCSGVFHVFQLIHVIKQGVSEEGSCR
jgi:hypothetical protein